jgi:hypothetical protein
VRWTWAGRACLAAAELPTTPAFQRLKRSFVQLGATFGLDSGIQPWDQNE